MGLARLLLVGFVLLVLGSRGLVCGNAELEVLMEIKASLDPENKVLTSWTNNGDPCGGSFDGVACNEHQKVATISLQGKRLSGKVPPAVAQLKCLSGLYLHYNSLTGEIPREISSLTELTDLYLDVNNLTGSIPSEIGSMASLEVLQLCCNQLNGTIPLQIKSLKKLSVLALQHNNFSGHIIGLANLQSLKSLDLAFNRFSGTFPVEIAKIPHLQTLDVRNNSLSGFVPPALKNLGERFNYQNNPGLCGSGFHSLRNCNNFGQNLIPKTADVKTHCNQSHCSEPSKLAQAALVAGIVSVTVTLVGAGLITFYRYRRGKQKIGSTADASDGRLSTDQSKDLYSRSASPLVCLEYSSGWDPLDDGRCGNGLSLQAPRYTLEEVESATQYFSEVNLLGRSTFSSVYKGILRDGTLVAIRSINVTSCKSEEVDFVNGLNLVTSLRHENLIRLRGVCCSKGRGECFLAYDFAPKGTLSQYLDLEDGSIQVLDWSTRVSIIKGIAEGIGYLDNGEGSKPAVVHQNISVEKILIDQQLNPLIMDSGLPKLLADDVIYSALKTSAAMGYMAPEYITTGRFTEKSDVFAFGVIIFQILSGKRLLSSSMRSAAECCSFENFIDSNLKGNFTEPEAAILGKIALRCTSELPDNRPTIFRVIEELNDWSVKRR